jgi:N-acylneuraminate cytidylyltransferase
VIPARGGSKRIFRKNIRTFIDKPIIAYSINAAIESDCFDQVIVSTDDDEIAEVAIKYGAEVPFKRPAEISGDKAGTAVVVKHAIQWFDDVRNQVEEVCCIYATAPFIDPQDIKKAYKQLMSSDADYVFTVCHFPVPIQRALKCDSDGRLSMFQPEFAEARSQDLEPAFHDAGQFYWGRSNAYLQDIPLLSEASLAYLLPRTHVQDIDTEEDWVMAELLYKALC